MMTLKLLLTQFTNCKHPIPKPEDLLKVLAGGQNFLKLELYQPYQQKLMQSTPTWVFFQYQRQPSISFSNFPKPDRVDPTRYPKLFATWIMC